MDIRPPNVSLGIRELHALCVAGGRNGLLEEFGELTPPGRKCHGVIVGPFGPEIITRRGIDFRRAAAFEVPDPNVILALCPVDDFLSVR